MKLSKKAFTLVELLVVIAVIALLMGILMPALSMARKQGQRAVCQSNLRQQHAACCMYIDDYDGYFPCNGVLTGVWYYLWGGKNGSEPGANQPKRFLNPYICKKGTVGTGSEDKQLHVFKCPADRGQIEGHYKLPPEGRKTCWDSQGLSYLPNFSANNNDASKSLWGRKITQIKNTHKLILVRDFSFLAYFITPEGTHGGLPFGYFYWHKNKYNGWGNVTFVDGHTEFLQATQDKPDFQNGDGWTFIVNK